MDSPRTGVNPLSDALFVSCLCIPPDAAPEPQLSGSGSGARGVCLLRFATAVVLVATPCACSGRCSCAEDVAWRVADQLRGPATDRWSLRYCGDVVGTTVADLWDATAVLLLVAAPEQPAGWSYAYCARGPAVALAVQPDGTPDRELRSPTPHSTTWV